MVITDLDPIICKAKEVEIYCDFCKRNRKEIFDDQEIISISYRHNLLIIHVGERKESQK